MKTRAAARRTNHKILREIAMYREIIHKAVARNMEKLGQENQADASPPLSRLLEARRDLANEDLDPSTLLRWALTKVEEEWREIKNYGEEFRK